MSELRCVDAYDLVLTSDGAVGLLWSDRERTHQIVGYAADGSERWRTSVRPPSLAADGEVVCVLEEPRWRPKTLSRLDLRDGSLRPIATFAATEWMVLAVEGSSALLMSEGGLERRDVLSGAVTQSLALLAPTGGEPLRTPWGLLVRRDGAPTQLLARETLEPVWSLPVEDRWDPLVTPRGLCASVLHGGNARALALFDPRDGAERWRTTAWETPLAASERGVLAGSGGPWIGALDADTGEERWREYVGRLPAAAARTDRWWILTAHELLAFDDEGREDERWSVEPQTTARCLRAREGVLWVGAARLSERQRPRGRAPMRAVARLPATGRPWVVHPDRALGAPRRPSVGAEAVCRSSASPREAWERLLARGILPERWGSSERRFFHDDEPAGAEVPDHLGAVRVLAEDVEGVERAEALWIEACARMRAVGEDLDPAPRWRFARAEPNEFEFYFPEVVYEVLMASVPHESSNVSSIDPLPEAFADAPRYLEMIAHRWARDELVWTMAQEARLPARAPQGNPAFGVSFERLANPFVPLRDLLSLGYWVDHAGWLRGLLR